MKVFSLDLRQRIFDAYNENIFVTQDEIAKRFNVSPGFVAKLVRQFKKTGSIDIVTRLLQTPSKLNPIQMTVLKELIEEKNDSTLQELCKALEEKISIKIATSTMSRMVRKLGFTRKKKRYELAKKTRKELNLPE
jgi:transposase